MHAAIIVESGVAIMIAITIAINMSLTLKSTVASFLLGRGAVPSGECTVECKICIVIILYE